MAPYDSDDSLDDDQDYTETDVLLGYASKDANGEETISKLGGRPEWLDPSHPPSYTHFKCASCSSPLTLLLQLNAELAERFPGHERRLYVFACRKNSCRRKDGSVRAMRATRVSADAIAKAKERRERAEREKADKEKAEAERREKDKGLGEELFGVAKGAFGAAAGANMNPFSTGGGGGAGAANPFAKPAGGSGASATNPFSTASAAPTLENKPSGPDAAAAAKDLPKTFAETLSLNNPQPPSGPPPPPEPWPADAELPAPYPVSYLADAEYETLDPQPPPVPQATRMELDDDNNNNTGGSSGGKEDKEVFESTIDSTFQKFADRLAQNPEQCIRYEFGGAPLLYSKTDAVGKKLHDVPAGNIGNVLPRCGHCGSKRVCEVQMTPQAIVELEEGDVLEGMDWGAVIVAVCEGDCLPRGTGDGEVGYAEEWVGVQWEELTSRR
ncbi:hypothetical protein N0V93_008100 [Gnomoniopsis smithogilvyi]|uniref:Programmed cell death protein 2 C-terminal domain-containing protein n=1 Tax=Gnomoniopsis smithogilvyi TaxID=1191159 RepID=A0A9W8YPP7_9PEZI|nr:hypothetical protein N0V93_008100 [Gnomoniopsis smithogilvyi]